MSVPVKRIKNMDPQAWQLFHDLAKAHGLEHADMLKWLTEEQVKREVAASGGSSLREIAHFARNTPPSAAAASGLVPDAADGSAKPPISG